MTIHRRRLRRLQLRRIDLWLCKLFEIHPGPDPFPEPDCIPAGVPVLRWLASKGPTSIEFLDSMD